MPIISPQARPSGPTSQEPIAHRSQVKASTGMNLPSLAQPSIPPKVGQPGTSEDTTPQAVTLSPQLTALSRKQAKLQSEIQAQREKEAAFEAQKADYVPKSGFKAKLQQNAVEALKELGVDYDEIAQLIISQQQGDDPVKALRSELDQMKAAQENNVNKQYEATLKQYKAETQSLISKDPKKYFMINKENLQDAVVQHIVDTWEENPEKVLTVEEASDDIEAFWREEVKKKKALYEELEAPEAPVQQEKKLPPPRTAAPRTLTNQVDVTPAKAVFGQFQHMSMKERIAQAVARSQR